jgi:ketosteroid isomerase-like protein
MRILRILLTASVLLAVIASTASGQQGDESVRNEILDLERQWDAAVLKGDLPFFERVMAEDFTHTNHSGEVRDRKQWLANHKPGQSPYEALNTEDLRIRCYGATALASGRIRPRGTTSTGKEIQGEYRFMRVWVKREGTWQAAAFQSTRVADRKE